MATQKRSLTPAEEKWSHYVHAQHLSPTVIRGFIHLGTAGPSDEWIQTHIKQCDECTWVFNRLLTKTGDEVVLDHVHEMREVMRQVWPTVEKEIAELREKLAAIRTMQWWLLFGVAVLVVLRLWPGLAR
jgi:hypothetical protein